MRNEKKFYDALERIFTGANISGEGGYINLLKIKHDYYKIILEQFKKDIDADTTITSNDSFKEEFFNRLYSFFKKYFSDSGSVYFVKTENWQKIYERVYTDNKDVILFWKTNMLYYVKSDILFNNMEVKIECEETKQQYNFLFDVGNLKNKKNNNKQKLIFSFKEIKQEKVDVGDANEKQKNKIYVLDVSCSTRGRITKLNDIVKNTKIPEYIINKAIRTFKKQSEVDFFINKNAQQFLTEQLDLYLHQIMLNDENKFDAERLNQLKTIKIFAHKIIDFISQFENELVEVWNKPKFVFNSNYVITLDRITKREIVKKIIDHSNFNEQLKEWQELNIVDEQFEIKNLADSKYTHLPIDTKYFPDMKFKILSLFNDLDNQLDGWLINSENYQALNTILPKFREKIQCIYIDPPFNTGKDFLYEDKFQSSTWLTLMNDRIRASNQFLSPRGNYFLHLDENASALGKIILQNIFPFVEIKEIVFDTNGTKDEQADLYGYKSFGAGFALKKQVIFHIKNSTSYFRKLFKPNRSITKLGIGQMDLIGNPKVKSPRKLDDYTFGIEKWVDKVISFEEIILPEEEKIYPLGDIWSDIYSFTQSEMRVSESLSFKTQKPEHLMRRIFQSTTNVGDIILDFFGGSGTSAATAQKLGRKWILVEMGQHIHNFYTDDKEVKLGVMGRLKHVLNGDRNFNAMDKKRRPALSKSIKWRGGGFFKYYELEQYENTLQQMKYRDNSPNSIWDTKDPFAQYIFYADEKFADVLNIKDKNIKLDFDKLYPNIDFAETISNLLGLPIKEITDDSVILIDEGKEKPIKTDYQKMTNKERLEFVRLLKPLLWWGE